MPDVAPVPLVHAAESRRFKPAAEHTIGESHRVEVIAGLTIGPDSILACRGLDAPSGCYEVLSARPVEVGATGTVRCGRPYRRFPLAWRFTPDEVRSHETSQEV